MLDALPHWQQLALYAMAAALALTLLPRLPYVGQALHSVLTFGLLALCVFFLLQQAPYQPWLAPLLDRVGADRQVVSGQEVRLRMSPDGHFWAQVTLNGVETRMLVDSGATLTTLSVETARRVGLRPTPGLNPIFARTGNGIVQARPSSVDELRLGGLTATDLAVAISPSLGPVDILGMNVLVRLASWRVEGQTMILTPHPQAESSGAS